MSKFESKLLDVCGFILFTVSFVFIIRALIEGKFDIEWYVYFIGMIAGIYMMGFRKIPEKMGDLLRKH